MADSMRGMAKRFLGDPMQEIVMKRTKSVLLIVGVVFLVSAALLMISMVIGFTEMPANLIAGESTVHSVARVAIVGCLLAAIGSMD
jgi:hypothetical protein